MGAEQDRLAAADGADGAAGADRAAADWRAWGPYVAERGWGTVREDYSADGDAWGSFPHDHARSRAYRWNEDGMAAVCDEGQQFCLGLALWNGRDPFLKERMFGLTGPEGNHGEDVKECWWYLDSTPTHSWMTWRYHYPQHEFPYAALVSENAQRGRDDPEYELVDTGAFDQSRYWAVTVDYAKAAPRDLLMRITVANRGPDEATLQVLPTLWFRNTWAWGLTESAAPLLRAAAAGEADADSGGRVEGDHPSLGPMRLAGDGAPRLLFCDNETNTQRLYGVPGRSAYPKDGINDHIVSGASTVNPAQSGTKAALHYELTVPAGQSREIRVRLSAAEVWPDLGPAYTQVLESRRAEADSYFADLMPQGCTPGEAMVVRQGVAGLMWGKQFYHYDVERWLDGDPATPPPPAARLNGRNSGWRHLNNRDVISMPDPWEYPWFAAWDLAFHCVAIAHVDPAFAKSQLLLILRAWYLHPNGQVPAYEWAFGDVNPPVHAWAALRVFALDGSRDTAFLERVFGKLLLNFTWWVNRKDAQGDNVFEGGFLGLDNIGPIDRSSPLPAAAELEQSDGTAWMAMYSLNMLDIALALARHDHSYEDLATKFFEHFAYIADAMERQGLWDEQDGFFYDVVRFADGTSQPLRVRSVVGLLPLCAVTAIDGETLQDLPEFASQLDWFVTYKPQYAGVVSTVSGAGELTPGGRQGIAMSAVPLERLRRILGPMLSPQEFLSPHGLRALSKWHESHPFTIDLAGTPFTVDYEPGESRSAMFGGNSNWRGPVWFPMNFLVIEALRGFGSGPAADLLVEYPTGSGRQLPLTAVADDLRGRLVGLFLDDGSGRRPVFGDTDLYQSGADWHDLIPFHEYFHGDTGKGLGASHQTGWTGLVVALVLDRGAGPAS